MSPEYLDPEVRATFRRNRTGFISRNAEGFISCPPSVIASTALRRVVPHASLEMPEGYDTATLETIAATTGWVDRDVPIPFRQAAELAIIGWQVLDLDSEGAIEPPLDPLARQSINHLLGEVVALNFDGLTSAEVSAADIAFIAATAERIAARK